MLHYRKATLDDVHQIIEMVNMSYSQTTYAKFGSLDIDDSIAFTIDVITEPTAELFIAEDGNKIVGLIYCVPMPPNRLLKDAWIACEPLWYVVPEHRGTGVAIKLLKMFEEWAKETQHDFVHVGALDDKTSKALTRLGYVEIERKFMKTL